MGDAEKINTNRSASGENGAASAPTAANGQTSPYTRSKKHYTKRELATLYRCLLERQSLPAIAARFNRPPGGIAKKLYDLSRKDPLSWRTYLVQPFMDAFAALHYQEWKANATVEQLERTRRRSRTSYRNRRASCLNYRYVYYRAHREENLTYRKKYFIAHREEIKRKQRIYEATRYLDRRKKKYAQAYDQKVYAPFGAFLKERLQDHLKTAGAANSQAPNQLLKMAAEQSSVPYKNIMLHIAGIYRPSVKSLARYAAFLDVPQSSLEARIHACEIQARRTAIAIPVFD